MLLYGYPLLSDLHLHSIPKTISNLFLPLLQVIYIGSDGLREKKKLKFKVTPTVLWHDKPVHNFSFLFSSAVGIRRHVRQKKKLEKKIASQILAM